MSKISLLYYLFYIYYIMKFAVGECVYFLSTLISLEGVKYIFLLSFQEVWRVFRTYSFYRM